MWSLLLALAVPVVDDGVDFQRDVLPILSERCFECHGPDEATREADLRLDEREGLFGDLGGYHAVVPGDLDGSELWFRVSDDVDPMPPVEHGGPLPTEEVETLRRWIESGAPWAKHWAYERPVRPAAPAVADAAWVRNEVDAFVLARLEREGLAPSPEADRATLLRRVTLHLTGLPPTPEEVDAFVADDAPDAYERRVDALLASTAHAEHLARAWLDLARYADTNGYEKDERRTMWRWRDWVIDAYADGMPFDDFTVKQLAGDLLPEPTVDDLVATGFHRNTMLNREGGVDREEFRVAAVLDRVNTTAQVWLGETLGCCQCHSHKYDPFTQREYYELFAFLNQTEDDGYSYAPTVEAPTRAQAAELARLEAELLRLSEAAAAPDPELDAAQRAWELEAVADARAPAPWRVLTPQVATSRAGSALEVLPDGSVLASGPRPATDTYTLQGVPGASVVRTLRVEALFDASHGGVGRSDDDNFVLTGVELSVLRDPGAHRLEEVALDAASANARQTNIDHRPVRALDGDDGTGWAVGGHTAREDVALLLHLAEPLVLDGDDELVVTLRQESPYGGYLLGRPRVSLSDDEALADGLAPLAWSAWRSAGPYPIGTHRAGFDETFPPETDDADVPWSPEEGLHDGVVHTFTGGNGAYYLERTVVAPTARRVLLRLGSDDSLKVFVNGALAHQSFVSRGAGYDQERVEVDLAAGENTLLLKVVNQGGPWGFSFAPDDPERQGMPPTVVQALITPPEAREPAQAAALRAWYRREVSETGRQRNAVLSLLEGSVAAARTGAPAAMILRERGTPRATHVLERGSFLSPGEEVQPGVPAVLHPLPEDAPRDRLALARWLVAPENPLTARVVVNRHWERLFGTGVVGTSNDFGLQGERPSHPALLDWLAVDLVEGGWDLRALLRTVVTSATYRQSSRVSPALAERDPGNRLLARGPRTRMDAEVLRDVALAAAGLLSDEVGGPSVFPPQPAGTWAMTYSGDRWTEDTGPDRWRRGLYTFWRRTAPYPTYMLFDAPSRELVCTRRARTNTPLQALAVLNDPVYVEAAGGLARRMMDKGGAEPDDVAAHGMRLCVGRAPHDEEVAVLVALFADERARLLDDPEAAAALARGPGMLPVEGYDAAELGAWTVVANVLLNLDETVTIE